MDFILISQFRCCLAYMLCVIARLKGETVFNLWLTSGHLKCSVHVAIHDLKKTHLDKSPRSSWKNPFLIHPHDAATTLLNNGYGVLHFVPFKNHGVITPFGIVLLRLEHILLQVV